MSAVIIICLFIMGTCTAAIAVSTVRTARIQREVTEEMKRINGRGKE